MGAQTVSKPLPRYFALFAVALLFVSAMVTIAWDADDSEAVSTGSSSSPLSSLSIDAWDAMDGPFYVKVGGSVRIECVGDDGGSDEFFYNLSGVTSGYGLSYSSSFTSGCAEGLVSGTISKAGTITVSGTYMNGLDAGDIRCTIYAISTGTPVTSVSISGSSSVTKGSTITLTATTSPTSATDRHVTWSISSGSSYASIQSTSDTTTGGKCVIKGVSAGSVIVKATAADGSGKTATKTIEVSNPSYTSTLKYNANGGSGAPSTQTYTGTSTSSHTFTISSTEPTRSGYTFLGWSTSSSATTASYDPGDTISVSYNGSKTLYAVWQENKQTYYAYLYYNANGGSGAPSTQSASIYAASASGSKSFTVSSTEPTRSEYQFLGWSTSSSATTASYDPGDSISVSYGSSKTLYAVWAKTYTSTLAFSANGGSGAPSSQTYTGTSTSSHTFTVPSTVPTKSGYTFLGWATSSGATSASYHAGDTISVSYNGTTTLYAVWYDTASIADRGNIASGETVRILVNEVSKLTIQLAVSSGAYMQAVSGASWVTYDSGRGTGTVIATPTQTGTYNFTVKLTIPGLEETTLSYTLEVVDTLAVDRGTITSGDTIRILVDEVSQLKISVAASAGAYMYAVSGESWVVYDSARGTGIVTASPTQTGVYDFSVKLVVPGVDETTVYYTLVVVESMDDDVHLDITSQPATKSLKVNQSWSYTPTTNIGGCTVSVSGADWLSVSNGTISGTPTTSGSYNVTVTVSKTGGYVSDSQTFVLKVYSALGFNSVPGANGVFAYAE